MDGLLSYKKHGWYSSNFLGLYISVAFYETEKILQNDWS